ncbi:AWPM-19-like family protein, partial [Zea mays]
MVLLSLEALRKRNVAGPLLLFNLALYVSMLGFASWALNAFVNPGRAAGPRAVSCELAYPCMHVWWCRSLVLPFSVLVFRLVENKQFKLSLISCMSCVRFSVYASYILWSYVCVDMLVSLSMCVCLFVCVSISVCKGRFGKFYLILILR